MSEEKQSYRGIMKATSIFGGVQVFQIIIQIIRSKFVAVLLGPTGMGISGLLASTIGLISSLTNFGLGTSAVKNIAEASSNNDEIKIYKTVAIFRKLVWITGLLGFSIALFLSPWLSELTFGNDEYTFAFAWLSITLLINQIASGQRVVLQGMRKIKDLALANVIGSFLGLITTVPLYYFFGIEGIVPVMIITSIISLVLTWVFSKKIKLSKIIVPRPEVISTSKDMLRMGIMISLSGLLATVASYALRIFINNYGSLADVGLYAAGFAIINTYVGLIFTAMATDYYPRLSEVANNKIELKKTVNQQAEISLLILGPVLVGFIVFIKFIIIILYSDKFVGTISMVHWAALGMFFKAIGWAIGFIFLAKADSKLFFWSEFAGSFYMMILNLLGYYIYGLEGLGVSFLVGYFFYAIQVYIITNKKYKFSFDVGLVKIFAIQFSLGIIAFLLSYVLESLALYLIGSMFIVISAYYSYKELDKRIGIKSIINKFIKK